MQTLLGSFTSHFGKQIVLGTFLPVSLFLGFWVLLIEPRIPQAASLLRRLALPNEAWQLAAIAFLSVLITSVLYNFNYTFTRLLEGYPWQDSRFGEWKVERYKQRAKQLDEQAMGLLALLSSSSRPLPRAEALTEHRQRLIERRRTHFPAEAGAILPTRLGNILRAFETYPNVEYGLDGVTFWPALVAVMSKEQLELVDDARTGFSFTVNLVVLAAASAALSTLYAGYVILTLGTLRALPLILAAVVFALLTGLAYRMSQEAASTWGENVRRAYDLNRAALWARYGVSHLPADPKEERALGVALSQQLIYGDGWAYEHEDDRAPSRTPPFSAPRDWPATCARTVSGNEVLLTRSVLPRDTGGLHVRLTVQGFDDLTAGEVVVHDTLPEGWAYVTDSGRLDGTPLHPRGVNPYQFHLGDVHPGQTRLVEYEAVRL